MAARTDRLTDRRRASSNDEVRGVGHHTTSFHMRFLRRPPAGIRRRDPHSDHLTDTRLLLAILVSPFP